MGTMVGVAAGVVHLTSVPLSLGHSPATATESPLGEGPRVPWLAWAALAAARARRRRSACRASCCRQERMPGSKASRSWKRPHCIGDGWGRAEGWQARRSSCQPLGHVSDPWWMHAPCPLLPPAGRSAAGSPCAPPTAPSCAARRCGSAAGTQGGRVCEVWGLVHRGSRLLRYTGGRDHACYTAQVGQAGPASVQADPPGTAARDVWGGGGMARAANGQSTAGTGGWYGRQAAGRSGAPGGTTCGRPASGRCRSTGRPGCHPV